MFVSNCIHAWLASEINILFLQKCISTPEGAMDPTFQIIFVLAFQHNLCSWRNQTITSAIFWLGFLGPPLRFPGSGLLASLQLIILNFAVS